MKIRFLDWGDIDDENRRAIHTFFFICFWLPAILIGIALIFFLS